MTNINSIFTNFINTTRNWFEKFTSSVKKFFKKTISWCKTIIDRVINLKSRLKNTIRSVQELDSRLHTLSVDISNLQQEQKTTARSLTQNTKELATFNQKHLELLQDVDKLSDIVNSLTDNVIVPIKQNISNLQQDTQNILNLQQDTQNILNLQRDTHNILGLQQQLDATRDLLYSLIGIVTELGSSVTGINQKNSSDAIQQRNLKSSIADLELQQGNFSIRDAETHHAIDSFGNMNNLS